MFMGLKKEKAGEPAFFYFERCRVRTNLVRLTRDAS